MELKKATAALCAAVIAFGMTACGTEDPADTTIGVTETKDSVVQQDTVDTGNETSSSESGAYVIPAESDFTVEDVDGGVKITAYSGSEGNIEIPNEIDGKPVVSIGECAFKSSLTLTSVKIPDSVETIENSAFIYCEMLDKVEMGANVKTIGTHAFNGCVALRNFSINDKVESIGNDAFFMCYALKEFTIPSSVRSLGDRALSSTGIEKITVPGSVETIGFEAFMGCQNLTEVILEEGVKELDSYIFDDCINLNRVEMPESLTIIEDPLDRESLNDNFALYGVSGSYAETFANEHGYKFVSE